MNRKVIRPVFFLALSMVVVLGLLAWEGIDMARNVDRNDGYEPIQPVFYSHKLHAGTYQMPCLYCHYGAERSRFAGIPAASVCMNCHSIILKDSEEVGKVVKALEESEPIEWIKVHRLADFVYFSHEQHVGLGKIQCQECHGPVEEMTRMRQDKPLTMGWCIDCHRKSDVVVQGTLETRKVSEVGGLDCAKCHY